MKRRMKRIQKQKMFNDNFMYNQMKRYKESLKNTPDPIMPSQLPQMNLDLRGLMNYAKSIGKKVVDLTDAEKSMFIRN